MKREEAITDLITLKEYFEEESGAYPISLEFAINELSRIKEDQMEKARIDQYGYTPTEEEE